MKSAATTILKSVAMAANLCVFALMNTTSAQAQRSVALELVLAVDTSTSVDAREFILQRGGLAAAFRHPQVHAAIETLGVSGMAVAVVAWAGQGQQRVVAGWSFVDGSSSSNRFADRIAAFQRPFNGFTDIAGALRFSTGSVLSNAFDGAKKKIDVSGDGTSDFDDPGLARDQAVASGITVNGLAIHAEEYDLGTLARIDLQQHFTQQVIGGEGAFFMEVESFEDFATAIRRKLVREIAGDAFARALMPPISEKAALTHQIETAHSKPPLTAVRHN
ncbi:MAG: DUF1194 domain-containing protein [Pseudomonadota bacterium]